MDWELNTVNVCGFSLQQGKAVIDVDVSGDNSVKLYLTEQLHIYLARLLLGVYSRFESNRQP